MIEDDRDLRDAITEALEDDGLTVVGVDNGLIALNFLLGEIVLRRGYVPDLLILDLMMPGMDGFQFWHWKQNSPRLKNIPTIVLTAMKKPHRAAWALYSGAEEPEEVLSKPLSLDELLGHVRARLEAFSPKGT